MRSPTTTGQEWPRPGIGVFQRTLRPVLASQDSGGNWPSATPVAPGPRNCGQSSALVTTPAGSSGGVAAAGSVSLAPAAEAVGAAAPAIRLNLTAIRPSR